MSYKLLFKTEAVKEWEKLDSEIKKQFRKKLTERLENPHIPKAKLSGFKNCYKIKLRQSGYPLVYQVRDSEIVISVIAIGKRERNQIYKTAFNRI